MKGEKITFPHYKDADDMCKWMAGRTGGTCILSFSGGKDAVASWLKLREYFHTIIPVFYYIIPGMQVIEENLQYYEHFFDTKIIRVPNPNFFRMLNSGVYQTPDRNRIIQSYQFPNFSYDDVFDWVKEDLKLPQNTWVAIGNRMFDNLNRYGSIKKYGAHNENRKTFYPIWDYKIADVVNICKQYDIKLSKEYTIWGKSFDGLDYRFIEPLKRLYPGDYELLKSYFPLIEADLLRYGND